MKSISIFFTILVTAINLASAQKFEAEKAKLSGGATVSNQAARSGAAYVELKGGSLEKTITLEEEGFFDIFINAAAPYGPKINGFVINGSSVDFSLSEAAYIDLKVVSNLKLTAGEHEIRIANSWGWINIDFFEFKKQAEGERFNMNKTLVTPEPTKEAQKLYNFLNDHYGKKIISGVMTLASMDEVNWLKTNTGKEPALIGLDFMHCGRNYNWYNDNEPMNDARRYFNRNGIPAFCWHWRDPSRKTEEFYTNKTTFDISKVFEPESDEYKAMINDIDYISQFMLKLQEDSVAVLWRPLHEAAGGWFWWGAKGPEPCKALWHIMFDRMVNHHGLRNLIWVWTREPNDEAWYPGDEFVDMVGRDIYRDGDHGSQILEFNQMNTLYGGTKMLTISECGSFPDPDNLEKDGAAWSFFMPWYGKYTRESKYNPLDLWIKTMNHEYVLTLDEMPNLRTYESQSSNHVLKLGNTIKVYPTYFDNVIHLKQNGPLGVIKLYALNGQMVKKETTDLHSISIDTSDLPGGLYLLKTTHSEAVKLIK